MAKELDVNDVFAAFKEQIGNQAQEIAILKATIAAMSSELQED